MTLDVHLYGERIGTLFPAGENDYRLAYAPELVEKVGSGASLLSSALPTRVEPYSAAATQAFVDGLLPTGLRRLKLARELQVDPGDGYALIAATGRDCAGAVTFLPKGTPVVRPAQDEILWIDDDELEEALAPSSRHFHPSREPRMRFALGGVRHKLGVVRDERAGRWAWPDVGLPSTHVVKPETGEYPELVANEMFCTGIVREIGLPVVSTSIERIGGRDCLVSERFDREGDGVEAKRVHQETFCQALGYPRSANDHNGGCADGPGFPEACGLLRAVARAEDRSTLFTIAFCNYMLGNGDAHGENLALVFHGDGVSLAPFYDLASTAVYDEPLHIGMVISEDYTETAYLLELAQIAEDCSFDFDRLRELAASTAAKLNEALDVVAARARAEGWYAPVIDRIAELAGERAFGLGVEVEY
ncbi:MAG TPA: HipA domain-containing protein [Solirubrobacterales bacterium]|nr:HipA domain-containing protein [Solirubrobacterales bacterium]